MGAELGQMFWLQACSEPKEIWNIGSTAWPPITGNNPTGSGLAEMGGGALWSQSSLPSYEAESPTKSPTQFSLHPWGPSGSTQAPSSATHQLRELTPATSSFVPQFPHPPRETPSA